MRVGHENAYAFSRNMHYFILSSAKIMNNLAKDLNCVFQSFFSVENWLNLSKKKSKNNSWGWNSNLERTLVPLSSAFEMLLNCTRCTYLDRKLCIENNQSNPSCSVTVQFSFWSKKDARKRGSKTKHPACPFSHFTINCISLNLIPRLNWNSMAAI